MKALYLLPLAAAALLGASAQAGAPRFLVKILDHDGEILIPGGAPAPHQGAMEVYGFGSRVDHPPSETGRALPGAGATTDFSFHKCVGPSTPLLQEALATGLLLPAVQILSLGDSGETQSGSEPLAVELHHVQVTGYEIHFGGVCPLTGQAAPTEQISLNFSGATWTYRQLDDDGSVEEESESVLVLFTATEDPGFDDDNDGIPNDLDQDDDDDGIPDKAEIDAGTNPLVDDADGDLDKDGQTNREEHVANTKMNDGSSFFAIESISVNHTPEGMHSTVAFPIAPGRHYRLLAATDPGLPREAWMLVDEFAVPEDAPEDRAEVALSPALLGRPVQVFFRVEVHFIGVPHLPPTDPNDPGFPFP